MAAAATETITVRWGGKDLSVEMRQESLRFWSGAVAGVKLYHIPGARVREWEAVILPLPEPINQGEGMEIGSHGATAQEALDKLAEQLREIAQWATSAIGEKCFHGAECECAHPYPM